MSSRRDKAVAERRSTSSKGLGGHKLPQASARRGRGSRRRAWSGCPPRPPPAPPAWAPLTDQLPLQRASCHVPLHSVPAGRGKLFSIRREGWSRRVPKWGLPFQPNPTALPSVQSFQPPLGARARPQHLPVPRQDGCPLARAPQPTAAGSQVRAPGQGGLPSARRPLARGRRQPPQPSAAPPRTSDVGGRAAARARARPGPAPAGPVPGGLGARTTPPTVRARPPR